MKRKQEFIPTPMDIAEMQLHFAQVALEQAKETLKTLAKGDENGDDAKSKTGD